jgi:hypothetical protein
MPLQNRMMTLVAFLQAQNCSNLPGVAPSIDNAGFLDAGILPAHRAYVGGRQDADGVLRRAAE